LLRRDYRSGVRARKGPFWVATFVMGLGAAIMVAVIVRRVIPVLIRVILTRDCTMNACYIPLI